MKTKEEKKKKITCGLIMPISKIDGYTAEHWIEVKNIITESVKSIEKYEIEIKLVSDADDIGVIQQRIVENVYTSDIIVCDVSAKNPNVMFELGMRLAFDKPTVIVIDNDTGYSFDTGVIEHVGYPKDLRFQPIMDFKDKLASKVLATYEKSIKGDDNSTFLKNFGTFKVAKLEETTVSADKMIIAMLSSLQNDIHKLKTKELVNHNTPKVIRRKNRIRRNSSLLENILMYFIEINDIKNMNDISLNDLNIYLEESFSERELDYDYENINEYLTAIDKIINNKNNE